MDLQLIFPIVLTLMLIGALCIKPLRDHIPDCMPWMQGSIIAIQLSSAILRKDWSFIGGFVTSFYAICMLHGSFLRHREDKNNRKLGQGTVAI
jgi:hypothetical protein